MMPRTSHTDCVSHRAARAMSGRLGMIAMLLCSLAFGDSTGTEIRGGALSPGGTKLYTWGRQLIEWTLPELKQIVLADGPFDEGGCLVDVNRDNRLDIVVQAGLGLGSLVWFEAPGWRPHSIDGEIQMHDCIAAALYGRPGILMTQRHMQVRFYERGTSWRMREIYSFYTASNQTGLALVDIDDDGRQDIVCGNYWIRAPERFELPWRLFAINTHSEAPESAMSRFAVLDSLSIVVSQGHHPEARLMLFSRPPDPRDQWPERLLNRDVKLVRPHGLAAAGGRILVGEHNGPQSRLFEFRTDGTHRQLVRGMNIVQLWNLEGKLLAAGPDGVRLIDYTPPRR